MQYCCYYDEGGGSSRRRRFAATSIFVGEEGVSNEPGRERREAKEFGRRRRARVDKNFLGC